MGSDFGKSNVMVSGYRSNISEYGFLYVSFSIRLQCFFAALMMEVFAFNVIKTRKIVKTGGAFFDDTASPQMQVLVKGKLNLL
jgi:hypothetical protein